MSGNLVGSACIAIAREVRLTTHPEHDVDDRREHYLRRVHNLLDWTLPEAAFRARLARSGQMREGWLDLAIDLDGTSIGRTQTFVPGGRALAPGTFDVGIGLREHARGKGYGREALTLFTGWLFEHAGADVVESDTDQANHAMRAVFRRAGWTQDGTVTEEGREWVRYRITRQEWQAMRP